MEFLPLAKKIVDLRISTRLACMCEEGDKALISLKTKMLHILSQSERITPPEIIARLKILKPNLTAMSKEMEEEGLIVRTPNLLDRRSITYTLTVEGAKYLSDRLNRITASLKGIFDAQEQYDSAERKIDEVLDFLSFLRPG